MIRIDRPDLSSRTREAKERALVDEVTQVHAPGRPVLVGTLTVEESERLAAGFEAQASLRGPQREERCEPRRASSLRRARAVR